MGVEPKIGGKTPPNHPMFNRFFFSLFSPSILGGKHPYFWFNTHILKMPFLTSIISAKESKLMSRMPSSPGSGAFFWWSEEVWKHMGVEPKIGGKPPKSWILIGFSIIFTIHFGGFPPIFWKHPYQQNRCSRNTWLRS